MRDSSHNHCRYLRLSAQGATENQAKGAVRSGNFPALLHSIMLMVMVLGLVACETGPDAQRRHTGSAAEPDASVDAAANDEMGEGEQDADQDDQVTVAQGAPDEELSARSSATDIDPPLEDMSYPDGNDWLRDYQLPPGYSWVTNLTDEVLSSPRASQGGTFVMVGIIPNTLRVFGPRRHDSVYHRVVADVQMPLIELHPNTKNYTPALASHWATHQDATSNLVFFRLNPRAQWSDGEQITVQDFIFTQAMASSVDVNDVQLRQLFAQNIKEVRELDEGIMVVQTHQPLTPDRILYYAAQLQPAPSHFYTLDRSWQDKYHTKIQPTSGPYEFDVEASALDDMLRPGNRYAGYFFKKVDNWWGSDLRFFKNSYNYDRIALAVAYPEYRQDMDQLAASMLVARQTSYMTFSSKGRAALEAFHYAFTVAESESFYGIRMGYDRKYFHYTDPPRGGTMGLFLNTQDKHLAHPGVRKAVIGALDIDGAAFNVGGGSMGVLDVFPFLGRVANISGGYGGFDHPDIKPKPFAPEQVQIWMEEAGYSLVDGLWTKDGEALELKIVMPADYITGEDPNYAVTGYIAKKASMLGFKLQFVQAGGVNNLEDLAQLSGKEGYQGVMLNGAMPHASAPIHYYEQLHSQANQSGTITNVSQLNDAGIDALIEAYQTEMNLASKQQLSHQIIARVHDLDIFVPLFYDKIQSMYLRSFFSMPLVLGTRLSLKHPLRYGWIDEDLKQYVDNQAIFQTDASSMHVLPKVVMSDALKGES